jgi:diguanylate cyclase (GGDEF)-like protein
VARQREIRLTQDDFQQINDSFGHQSGDRVLQATARILRGNTRETDLIARHGGAEFVVVLPKRAAAIARCPSIGNCPDRSRATAESRKLPYQIKSYRADFMS